MAKRYTAEEKAAILSRVNEVGTRKACEEFGVTLQTVYKWRHALKDPADNGNGSDASNVAEIDREELKELVAPVAELEARVKRLEEENAILRDRNERMRRMLLAIANA